MTGRLCVVVFCVPFLGLAAAGCSTNNDTSATEAGSCEPAPESEGPGWVVTASAVSSEGRELTYRKHIIAVGDDGSGTMSETTIDANGERVMQVVEESTPTRHEVRIAYGPLVPGLTMATAVVEDEVLTGSVNGRAVVPMPLGQQDPLEPRFEDGELEPDPGIDPDIEDALPRLFGNAADGAQMCAQANGAAPLVVEKRGDRGHVSLPAFSDGCLKCKGICATGLLACNISAAAGCVAATLWYALCLASAEAACFTTYAVCILGCNADGEPCCPVGCGDGCCDDGETCINEDQQLCCGTSQFICLGRECCDNTEVCINGGPEAGTCCDPANRCNENCCEPGDSCITEVSECCEPEQTPCVDKCCDEAGCIDQGLNAGTCCEPDDICNDTCCSDLDSCIRFPNGTGLCCGFATPACGNRCCGVDESCLGNNACCPNNRVCQGICCPEGSGCDLQTNKCKSCPMPNEKYCSESDSCCPLTEVCTPIQDLCCPAGQMYCGIPLQCRPSEECLR